MTSEVGKKELSRRDFLKMEGFVACSTALAACSPSEQERIKRELLHYKLGDDQKMIRETKTEQAVEKQDTRSPLETAVAASTAAVSTSIVKRVKEDLALTAESNRRTPTPSPTPTAQGKEPGISGDLIHGVEWTAGIATLFVMYRLIRRKLRQPKPPTGPSLHTSQEQTLIVDVDPSNAPFIPDGYQAVRRGEHGITHVGYGSNPPKPPEKFKGP